MTTRGQPTAFNNFALEQRRTLVINQSMVSANPWNVDISSAVGFTPKYVIVRQLCYANVAGTDSGIYLLWSNLNNGSHIGAFYCGIQGTSSCPNNIIPIGVPLQNIQFNLTAANSAFVNPTGQISLVLEFVSPKPDQTISV